MKQAVIGGCYPTLRWALFGFENQEWLIRKLACSVAAFQRAFVLLHDRYLDTLEILVDGALGSKREPQDLFGLRRFGFIISALLHLLHPTST